MGKQEKLLAALIITMGLTALGVYAAEVSGSVRNARWGPGHEQYLSGVTVYLKSNPSITTVSDDKGNYVLKDIPVGTDYIVFGKNGFVTDMKPVNAEKEDSKLKIDMALVEYGLTGISDYRLFHEYLNLDFPGLEKVKAAVEANDLLTAKMELINYYRNRETPLWFVQPRKITEKDINPNYNTYQVDQELQHNIPQGNVIGNPDYPPGSGNINWNFTPNGDKEWTWWMNRMFPMNHFGIAWENTLDSKYAYEYMAEYIDWIADNPKPVYKDNNGTWRTIEAGIRNQYPLLDPWNRLLFNDDITTEARITIIKSFIEHAEYLSTYSGSGNWLIFECRGLYGIGTVHPEFKQSQSWKDNALGRAYAQLVNQVKPDGWQFELTPNYHIEAINSLTEIQKIAKLNNVDTQLKSGLKKGFDVENVITLPGARAIPLNDTNVYDLHSMLLGAAKLFAEDDKQYKCQDYLLTATDFRAGLPHAETSHFFNYAGYVFMRDFWGPDNIMGYLEVGPSGKGPHGFQSRDKLQFVVSAFGRDMLVDPGVYNYTSDPMAKYMYKTSSHNTITVDGYEQVRRKNGMDEPAENAFFYGGKDFDFAKGLYNETYDETKHIPVNHERKVFFDKSGIFFVSDLLIGDGKHTIEQWWNIAPSKVEQESKTKKVTVNFDDGTGLIIIPLDSEKLESDIVAGGNSPLRGWLSYNGNVEKTPSLRYALKNTALPVAMDTVIIPFRGLTPKLSAERITAEQGGQLPAATASGVILSCPGQYTEYYLIRHFGEGAVKYGEFIFDGEAAVIRKDNLGKVISVKKYPEDSTLLNNGLKIGAFSAVISSPTSGSIIGGDRVNLRIDITPDEIDKISSVEYYAQYNDGIDSEEKKICESGAAPFDASWDISNLQNQNNVTLWAVVKDKNGNTVVTDKVRDIQIDRFTLAPGNVELEDRSVEFKGESYAVADDSALKKAAQLLMPGASASRRFKAGDGPFKVTVRAKASESGKNSKMIVEINGVQSVFDVKNVYADYEMDSITPVNGIINISVICDDGSPLVADSLKVDNGKDSLVNNMILRHMLSITDDNYIFGDDSWTDYTYTAKMKIQSGLSTDRKDGAGICARFTKTSGYGVYYSEYDRQLQIRIRSGSEWEVLKSADFSWDMSKWYYIKVSVIGDEIKAKAWPADTAEPDQWNVECKDNTYKSGSAGITADRTDLLIDTVEIIDSTSADSKTLYYNNMEYLSSGERPGGWIVTKSSTWSVMDLRSIR